MTGFLRSFCAVLAAVALAVISVGAQTKKPPPRPTPEPPQVDVRATFNISTSSEKWTIDDPVPTDSVTFANKPMPLADRQVNDSSIGETERQVFFPVSWFEPYQAQNPDIKYVVVKYRGGKAYTIMAEYLPERLAFPRAEFKQHPDGKTFYKDLATLRQGGKFYMKQAFSNGVEDGKGNLWVTMVMVYVVPEDAGTRKGG